MIYSTRVSPVHLSAFFASVYVSSRFAEFDLSLKVVSHASIKRLIPGHMLSLDSADKLVAVGVSN